MPQQAVELAFQKEKLRLLREENTELQSTILTVKQSEELQAQSADDIMTHNRRVALPAPPRPTSAASARCPCAVAHGVEGSGLHRRREIAHAVARASVLESRVKELEETLRLRDEEISDLNAERDQNRRKLEDRSAAVQAGFRPDACVSGAPARAVRRGAAGALGRRSGGTSQRRNGAAA